MDMQEEKKLRLAGSDVFEGCYYRLDEWAGRRLS